MPGQIPSNGSFFNEFEQRQSDKFDSLESILRDGFSMVASELKLLREQGYIPVNVHERMVLQIREINSDVMVQYKIFITLIVRALCVVLVGLVFWLTGIKYLAPHVFGQ